MNWLWFLQHSTDHKAELMSDVRPVNPDRVTTVNQGVFILVSGMLLAQPRNWKI